MKWQSCISWLVPIRLERLDLDNRGHSRLIIIIGHSLYVFKDSLLLIRGLIFNILTIYQHTPDIVISEVSECLQGHSIRSVFLDLIFMFCEL